MKNIGTKNQTHRLTPLRFAAILIICIGFTHSVWAQWTKAGLSGKDIYGIDSNGVSMFIGTVGSGIYKGTGKDTNWVSVSVGLTTKNVMCVKNDWGFLYAGTDSGFFLSRDTAKTWAAKNNGLTSKFVRTIASSGTWIYAGTEGGGIFKSFDVASSWTQLSVSPTASTIRTQIINNGTLFAGTDGGGVFKSTDGGTTWNAANTGLTSLRVRALAFVGTTLFAGTPSGVFKSTDPGNLWSLVNTGLTCISVETFAVSGTTLYAGCSYDWATSTPGGVFKTTNNGTQWTALNTGLTTNDVRTLFCTQTNIFAGTLGGGLYKAAITSSVGEENGTAKRPAVYALAQNFPNPFNPTTTIAFSIPSRSVVSLKVYNVLGKEVATIVSEELPPGNYSRQWNASGVTSGVYFYRLQAGSFSETKKLGLLR